MLTRNDAMNLLEIAIQHSKADQTEVVLMSGEHGLTRLANGGIHQNVATANTTARARAVLGKRVGVAVSNRVDAEGLRELVDRAIAIARVSEPNPEFVSLPSPTGAGESPRLGSTVPTPMADVDLANFGPSHRADAALTIVNTARGNGVTAAGHVATSLSALAVGNSLGVREYNSSAESTLLCIMTKGDASGYAQWSGQMFTPGAVAEVAGRAASKCLAGEHLTGIEPGKYTVILEPPAVAEMLAMLGIIGLGATALQEDRSFMAGKIGERLVSERITLRDDAYHAGMLPMPFDFEGMPKRTVTFFDKGVASGVVYDSYTANKEKGRQTTGHALPAPNAYGPLPMHLVLDHGNAPAARLMEGIERGVLVTRFHYVNIVHPKETILTGMTRDGTFLIDQGSIAAPLKNLRFTQSVLEALRNVSALEDTHTLVNQEGIYCLVPSLRIEGFSFTS